MGNWKISDFNCCDLKFCGCFCEVSVGEEYNRGVWDGEWFIELF